MKKILLVEDHEEIRENAAEILELSNYKVIQADNGKKGLEIAIKELPDLIICDIMMPLLDGYGVIHALQHRTETADIPFIFLTARSDKSDIRKGMDLGADDYLTKPFEGIELLKAVEACLAKKERHRIGHIQETTETGTGELQLELSQRAAQPYRKKQMIYMEGQRPTHLFYILAGKVKTYKLHQDGKEFITNISGPGDFIGYTAILEDINYQDNTLVLEDAELVLIPRQEFLDKVGNNTEIARQFIKLLSRNVTEKEEHLLNLAYNSLRKRVANGLLQVLDKFKTGADSDDIVGISRENLANIIGSATESLTRTLSDFKDEQLIDIRKGKIYLLEETKLRSMAN
jgi:DNA-binding response OmpR family regulator